MGWIGVDLFFVLSGFLVSGLLFKEYKRYGNVDSVLFLIRRGFKIYPVYYFFLFLTVWTSIFINEEISYRKLLFDALFISNYSGGIWEHCWSLCVEEHFYILLSILIPLLIRLSLINRHSYLISGIIGLLILSFSVKFINLYFFSPKNVFYATHNRFDSLLSGVLTGYFYYFKFNSLTHFFNKYNSIILIVVFIFISFSPFLSQDSDNNMRFICSFGFTLLYIAFNLLLIYFLFKENINEKLRKIFGTYLTTQISNIGLYSYSIYLFHMYVFKYLITPLRKAIVIPDSISFIIYFFISIILGIGISKIIEIPFLNIRDKYFQRKN